jgi:hypothetical protein
MLLRTFAGRIGAVVGAISGIAFVAYHNAHVSVWTGGYVYNAKGYLMLSVVGAVVGAVIGSWIERARVKRDG